jgi:hypothetical protein
MRIDVRRDQRRRAVAQRRQRRPDRPAEIDRFPVRVNCEVSIDCRLRVLSALERGPACAQRRQRAADLLLDQRVAEIGLVESART